MKKLLLKEFKLACSPLAFFFIAFGLLTFAPNYPILVGGFFVCLGIFQSFLSAGLSNDVVYTALLPIRKSDAVKSKYVFCVFIEACGFLVSAAATLVRMTFLSDLSVYKSNALMNANLVYLAYLLVLFGLFNAIFVCGFFKTAYAVTKPFVTFAVVGFLFVGIAEALWHFPGLSALNSFGFDNTILQVVCLGVGIAVYILFTFLSEKKSERLFEKIDL